MTTEASGSKESVAGLQAFEESLMPPSPDRATNLVYTAWALIDSNSESQPILFVLTDILMMDNWSLHTI